MFYNKNHLVWLNLHIWSGLSLSSWHIIFCFHCIASSVNNLPQNWSSNMYILQWYVLFIDELVERISIITITINSSNSLPVLSHIPTHPQPSSSIAFFMSKWIFLFLPSHSSLNPFRVLILSSPFDCFSFSINQGPFLLHGDVFSHIFNFPATLCQCHLAFDPVGYFNFSARLFIWLSAGHHSRPRIDSI